MLKRPEINQLPSVVKAYLSRNPLISNLESSKYFKLKTPFSNVVVIPVLAELENLPLTLDSLLHSLEFDADESENLTLIILVVNNPPLTSQAATEFSSEINWLSDNRNLLLKLRENSLELPKLSYLQERVTLCWIDASSEGLEINRKFGVGGARKIGMDAALYFLDWNRDPLIISLDADSLVDKNYMCEIRKFFNINPLISGATIDFYHQSGSTPEEERAIRLYEAYIRDYVLGLRSANSPYSYHSIGSTMAFRASAYIKAGGMRPKPAGEDFYFMQALCKVGMTRCPFPIGEINNTRVYPSSRLSERVPFGTGPKLMEYINGMKKNKGCFEDKILFNPHIFRIIKEIIFWAENGTLFESYDKWFSIIPPEAQDFFVKFEFKSAWGKILKNTPLESRKLVIAFHTWFDAFRILKFIHFCENEPYRLEKVSLDRFYSGKTSEK